MNEKITKTQKIFLQIAKTSISLKIVLAFYLCPRLLFHVAQATAYQGFAILKK